ILSPDAFSVAVIMTFLTTLIAPPIFSRMIDKEGEVLRKPPRLISGNKYIAYEFPNRETAELLLTKIIDAFKNEGFYVNLLDIRRQLYGIRKEDSFISIQFTPKKIIFDCREEDVSFIHTLFYEALAHLQRTIRQLQSLTYREDIGKKIFQDSVNHKPGVNGKDRGLLTRLFTPNAVEYNLQGGDKEEVLRELVQLFIDSGELLHTDREEAFNLILSRENDISTGMQSGIAFPHARTGLVKRMKTVMGINKSGVDFNSLDKLPSRIFIASLIPADQPEPYLKMMSTMSRFLSEKENRARLIACESNRELYEVFSELGG
ncbi:MAG TPA: PTS sugar transporter subunit IIA, partial [Proteobacteria bacterium]|nr:PTS sugar transporter subunit IIA [Pseudomonadota bacterium]